MNTPQIQKRILQPMGPSRFTWVFGDGHGEGVAGKRSPQVPPGILEWEFNEDIVKRVIKILGPEISTELLAPGSENIPLGQRVRRLEALQAEHGNCACISIHANADGMGKEWTDAKGFAIFVHPDCDPLSRDLAEQMELFYGDFTDIKSRGIRTANFYFLRKTNKMGIPVILLECDFMTNLDAAKFMASEYGRDMIAKAIAATVFEVEERGL